MGEVQVKEGEAGDNASKSPHRRSISWTASRCREPRSDRYFSYFVPSTCRTNHVSAFSLTGTGFRVKQRSCAALSPMLSVISQPSLTCVD